MSRQEIKFYGKQEFRQFPLVTLEELPSTNDLGDIVRRAARGELGTRIKALDKPLVCGVTAKSYKFWDNLIYHYKNLAPLHGPKVEFHQYTCPHDNWLFTERSNLKLHNKVCKYEQAQATEIEHRLNLDNAEWVHPSKRNEERYYEHGPEDWKKKEHEKIKKSRFLTKEREVRPSYKDQMKKRIVESEEKETFSITNLKDKEDDEAVKSKEKERNRHGVTLLEWPHDPEDLEPLPRPPPKNIPKYYGWTHSDNADSWYLEAHTPSIHEAYEDFYGEAMRKRVICPKFYSSV